MKKLISVLLITAVILTALASCTKKPEAAEKQRFTETFIDYFDTVSTVVGFAESGEEFDAVSDDIEKLLKQYHELYDIYNTYSGINNICTINKKAGVEPVVVDERIIDLLELSCEVYEASRGYNDITNGALFKLWHDARDTASYDPEEAYIPSQDKIEAAMEKCGFDKVIIDRENNSVFITEKGIRLDVGAIAKGYATEMIAQYLEEKGISGYALNFGGNIRVVGDKPGGEKWTASIADPENQGNSVMTIELYKKSVVTSGSYQRYFELDGERYHHIINPFTGYPKNDFLSVTVVSESSAVSDAFSTALFSIDIEMGKKIVNSNPDIEALWITSDGRMIYSDKFEEYIIKE